MWHSSVGPPAHFALAVWHATLSVPAQFGRSHLDFTMDLVIPKYSVAAVIDWRCLLVDTAAGPSLRAASAAFINFMPVIGITELTRADRPIHRL